MKIDESTLRLIIRQELAQEKISEGMNYHLAHGIGLDRNIYRPGSDTFFALFREARMLANAGLYHPKGYEQELLETDLGEFGVYEGKEVPLDWPMLEEDSALDDYDSMSEAKYKGREVELGKPKRGSGGKAYVYVRDPKTKNIKKVKFGSSLPDAMGDSDAAKKRRKSFAARHRCSQQKDRTKAAYWACRATKFFGRNVPGWW